VKAIRIELLIATLALLASAAASIATVIQTSVVGRQLSASVWPYLTIENTSSATEGSIALVNERLGPAIIQDACVAVGGKRSRSSAFPILSICYCSILQQCLIVDEASTGQPRSVRACGNEASVIQPD
jgi:hypothetical protein